MANTLGTYLQGAILDWINGSAYPAAPANVYIALFTSAPTNAGGGTEVSGTGYARCAYPASNWTKSGTNPTQITNAIEASFNIAGAAWGLITDFAVFDAASAGNLLFRGALTASKTILINDPVSFEAGSLILQMD